MPDERIMVMLLGKSALFIGFGNGRSHGADSLDFDSSPSGSRSYLVTNFSTSAAVIFVIPCRYSHWSVKGMKSSSTNTLLPSLRAFPCSGKATRLPNPPVGIRSWLGKKRSYDLKDILPSRSIASVRIALPNRRAV